MTGSLWKLPLMLVGGHLLLGTILLGITATRGINDQDASYALAMVFHFLNLPSIWLLRWMGAAPGIAAVLVVGVVQWTAVGLLMAVLCRVAGASCCAILRRTNTAAE